MKLKKLNYYLPFIFLGAYLTIFAILDIIFGYFIGTDNLTVVIILADVLSTLLYVGFYFIIVISSWLIFNGIFLIAKKDKRIFLIILSLLIGILLIILAINYFDWFYGQLY